MDDYQEGFVNDNFTISTESKIYRWVPNLVSESYQIPKFDVETFWETIKGKSIYLNKFSKERFAKSFYNIFYTNSELPVDSFIKSRVIGEHENWGWTPLKGIKDHKFLYQIEYVVGPSSNTQISELHQYYFTCNVFVEETDYLINILKLL